MECKFKLNYVVIKNDGVNEYEAEAGFNSLPEAVTYANKRASEYEKFNTSDSAEVYLSARVAHYEVCGKYGSEWRTVHETNDFYND